MYQLWFLTNKSLFIELFCPTSITNSTKGSLFGSCGQLCGLPGFSLLYKNQPASGGNREGLMVVTHKKGYPLVAFYVVYRVWLDNPVHFNGNRQSDHVRSG